MEKIDILIKDANELITLKGLNSPRIKKEMSDIGIIKNGSIAIKNGFIIDIGKNLSYKSETIIDARGKTVMPGFVDPHTHLVFSGSREFELDWKLKGSTYNDIKNMGGGIFYTVEKTRKTSYNKLLNEAKIRLDNMLSYGTTTCEAKTGYGLNTETELKILKVQKKLNDTHTVDIVSTFLGAHAIPKEQTSTEYIKILTEDMLPKVTKYAIFCDVFCEKEYFTIDQSREILESGKKYGLLAKIHADEIVDTGGASLAAKIGAVSADHLLMTSDKGIKDIAKAGVIGVLLPGTLFSLMLNNFPQVRKMIDSGVPIALATDLNPNCYVENMQFIIQLACFKLKMTPAEAICASTFNAACAISKQNEIGSLEKGKIADIIILDTPNHLFIPYHFGINHIEKVIKKGCIVI